MDSFLKTIASKILSSEALNTGQLCVVLPNRRSGLFLKKHLAELSNQPIFAPKILSIEDFLTELSSMKMEDPLYLLFDLYKIHKQYETENLRSFSEFISFGEVILRDFSEMDMYLVDTDQLFTWLSEERAITLWNVEGQPLTEYQQNYLAFFKALHLYYEQLNSVLESKQKAYKGRAYRYVAEHIETLADRFAEKEIIFAGFNALTACEKKIFRFLERSGKASIYWDADEYYMDSPIQEAGLFLRQYKEDFENLKIFEENYKAPKNIEIIGASENILQAKFAGEKLREYIQNNKDTDLEDIVVVLADESLLLPVLNSLPEELSDVNVTMGYSFRFTPIHNLAAHWLDMYARAEKSGKNRFSLKDLLPILTHPYVQKIAGGNELKSKVMEAFSTSNKFYFTVNDLENLFSKTEFNFGKVVFLFNALPKADRLIAVLEKLSTILLQEETETINKEFLLSFRKLILHFAEANEQYQDFDSVRSLSNIYMSMSGKIKIPFYGEPLRGLQIMGLLETRNLDFRNVIMLSVNEGVLPGGKKQHSLIPVDIRRSFGIPVYRENDAIYAYHFYRVLQRASQATLIYNADSGGMGSKTEKSRFIKQLQVEMPLYNPQIQITEKILTAPVYTDSNTKPIDIAKDEIVCKRLRARAQNGFSPTALNRYLACPLRFYFAEVLKVEEPEDLSETIDQKMLGTVIHAVLENIFALQHFENGKVEAAKINYSEAEVASLLQKAFEKNYNSEELEKGKNKIFTNIAQKMISRFLEKQQELSQKSDLQIIGLETELKQSIEISIGEELLQVLLYGKADRIDKLDGVLRIADYKTGNVQDRDLKVDSTVLADFELTKIPEKLFQLLTYSYLCYKQEEYFGQSNFISGIYSFRKLESDLLPAEIDKSTEITMAEMTLFEDFLKHLLEDIFDDKKTFSQTPDKKKCIYCNFASICGR